MRIIRQLLVGIIWVGFSAIVQASSTTEALLLQHPQFEQALEFNVVLPSGYDQNKQKSYPLLFDFHPYATTYLSGMHDWMSHNGEWPWLQTIIVTPAYGNPVGKLFDSTAKSTPLLDFFEQQLFVELDKKYRTNGFRLMSGFRVNGSIVLSTLLRKPDLVNAYIAVSPELSDDFVRLLSDAEQQLKTLDQSPRFLLFSHGTNVKEEHQQTDYASLHRLLQQHAPTSLDWHYQHFADHYFMSLPLLSTIQAIEILFDDIHHGLAPDSAISQQGVAAIIAHYQFLSEQKYGFNVSPKPSIRHLGNALLAADYPAGLAVLQQLVEIYPDDPYSYHYLAAAHASKQDFATAVRLQSEAVARSTDQLTWHQRKLKAALSEYQNKLKQD